MGLLRGFQGIQWGSGNHNGHGMGQCSQCRNEPATGSVRMANGKFVKVGRSCKRAMGTSGRQQYQETKNRQNPEGGSKHSSGGEAPQGSGGGKHRTGTRKGNTGGRGR